MPITSPPAHRQTFALPVAMLIMLGLLAKPALGIVNGEAPADDDKQYDAVCALSLTDWLVPSPDKVKDGQHDHVHNWFGNAVLIAPNLVMTSRHLIGGKNPKNNGKMGVRFRRHFDGSIGSKDKGYRSYHQAAVAKWIVSPNSDLAIGILSSEVAHIDPIPLATPEMLESLEKGIIAGWGSTSRWRGDHGPRNELRVAPVTMDVRQGRVLLLPVQQLEARERGKDPKTGKPKKQAYVVGDAAVPNIHDSGGSMLIRDDDGKLFLAGIIATYAGGPTITQHHGDENFHPYAIVKEFTKPHAESQSPD